MARLRHALTEMPQRAPDADIEDLLPFNCIVQKNACQLATTAAAVRTFRINQASDDPAGPASHSAAATSARSPRDKMRAYG